MTAKEIATKVAIELIAKAAEQDKTGEEKEAEVCEILSKLDNHIIGLNFIPDELEAELLDLGIDKVQEYISNLDIKAFVKTQYNRIKRLLKRLFRHDD
jgi:hypothetical protein